MTTPTTEELQAEIQALKTLLWTTNLTYRTLAYFKGEGSLEEYMFAGEQLHEDVARINDWSEELRKRQHQCWKLKARLTNKDTCCEKCEAPDRYAYSECECIICAMCYWQWEEGKEKGTCPVCNKKTTFYKTEVVM